MTTIPAYEFIAAGPRSKFPHTGPVYYGTGKLPYTAALKGVELKSNNGRLNRAFKTAETAARAIVLHVEQGA